MKILCMQMMVGARDKRDSDVPTVDPVRSIRLAVGGEVGVRVVIGW